VKSAKRAGPSTLPAGLADFKLWQIGIELDGQMQVITIRT
jgi:hypothetical protein